MHHTHTLLGYTHFHVQMGRVRIRCHQRFYGFDRTTHRCSHQRRHLAVALGGEGVDGWGMVGIEERLLVYIVYCVCVCVHGEGRDSTDKDRKEVKCKNVTPTPSLLYPYNPPPAMLPTLKC